MQNIITNYFIKVKKGQKNKGFDKKNEKKMIDEFRCITKIIELDKNHKLRLEKCNENCRYKNILPYKDNIVKLTSSNNFINASWMHMPYPYYFIATQGPLPHTIEDFWTMCYDNKVSVIIMLCNLKEDNINKCADYWNIKNLKKYEIKLINEKKDEKIYIRSIELYNKEKNNSYKINQIHFTSWEDHNSLKKNYCTKIIKIIKLLDEYRGKRNAVIHCSAGVGRTGTFISLYNLYHEIMRQIFIENNNDEIIFCIFNIVRKIKEMRMFSVENENQYIFLYQFSDFLLKNYNTKK